MCLESLCHFYEMPIWPSQQQQTKNMLRRPLNFGARDLVIRAITCQFLHFLYFHEHELNEYPADPSTLPTYMH